MKYVLKYEKHDDPCFIFFISLILYHLSRLKCSHESQLLTVQRDPSFRALNHLPWMLNRDHVPSSF